MFGLCCSCADIICTLERDAQAKRSAPPAATATAANLIGSASVVWFASSFYPLSTHSNRIQQFSDGSPTCDCSCWLHKTIKAILFSLAAKDYKRQTKLNYKTLHCLAVIFGLSLYRVFACSRTCTPSLLDAQRTTTITTITITRTCISANRLFGYGVPIACVKLVSRN